MSDEKETACAIGCAGKKDDRNDVEREERCSNVLRTAASEEQICTEICTNPQLKSKNSKIRSFERGLFSIMFMPSKCSGGGCSM